MRDASMLQNHWWNGETFMKLGEHLVKVCIQGVFGEFLEFFQGPGWIRAGCCAAAPAGSSALLRRAPAERSRDWTEGVTWSAELRLMLHHCSPSSRKKCGFQHCSMRQLCRFTHYRSWNPSLSLSLFFLFFWRLSLRWRTSAEENRDGGFRGKLWSPLRSARGVIDWLLTDVWRKMNGECDQSQVMGLLNMNTCTIDGKHRPIICACGLK